MSDPAAPGAARPSRAYLYVLIGVVVGGAIGATWPSFGAQLKPVMDAFINLIRMMIAPVIFCTVVLGIAGMGDLRKLGRVGGKALLYFEVVSTLALVIGLAVANLVQPGVGASTATSAGDVKKAAEYAQAGAQLTIQDHLLKIIPRTLFEPLGGSGDLLQVLLVAVLCGVAMATLGARAQALQDTLAATSRMLFVVVGMIMRLAPIGACAAMAFTVGNYGTGALVKLAWLVGVFYLTCAIFIGVVLGAIARAHRLQPAALHRLHQG